MKLTFLLLTAALLQVYGAGKAQSVSISGKDITLRQIFSIIKQQTGYVAFYNRDMLSGTKPVTISASNMPLHELLAIVLKDQPVDYLIKNRNIILSEKKQPADIMRITHAMQALPVYGRIVDMDGEPVSGATIRVKGGKKGTSTDANGAFSLEISEQEVLEITSIGFAPVTIRLEGNAFKTTTPAGGSRIMDGAPSSLLIQLARSTATLGEVVINKGYYTERKEFSTSSVSTVQGEVLNRAPVSDPLAALAGRVPGFQITQGIGIPGRSIQVRLRGQNSIQSGNNPLYVVDGVPFYDKSSLDNNFVSNGSGMGSNPLLSINIADIEKIDVLKDADATAIYGSRGANGVILITTRKGKAGKTRVNINAYQGIAIPGKKWDLLNREQYLAMRREAFANDGATVYPAEAYDLNGTWDTTRSTDWQKELNNGTAITSNIQASVSGGTANTRFTVGGGYYRESIVILKNFPTSRASAHSNISHTSTNERLTASLTVDYTVATTEPPGYLSASAIRLPPVAPPLFDEDGKLNWENGTFNNPAAEIFRLHRTVTDFMNSSMQLGYRLVRGLEVRVLSGYSVNKADEQNTIPLSTINPYNSWEQGESSIGTNSVKIWNIEPQLNYSVAFGNGELEALAGTTFMQQTQSQFGMTGRGFSSDALIENIQAANIRVVNGYAHSLYKYNAVFGRVNYIHAKRYIANLTVRRDGSSRYGPAKKFSNFGSASIGWIFSEEAFAKRHLRFLSFGKLRANIGITGNNNIGDYSYLDTYTPYPSYLPYNYLGVSVIAPDRLFNPDYAWERVRKLELAAEFGFFRNRLNLNINYYRNRTSNQLLDYPLSTVAGFPSILLNLPALIQNTGLEADLTATCIDGKNFSWSVNANISIPRNVLLQYPGLENSSYRYAYEVGKSLFISKRIKSLGVDPQTGLFTYLDVDKSGRIDFPQDYTTLVFTGTNYYGALNNTLRYKGLQLELFFQYVRRPNVRSYNDQFYKPGYMSNQPTLVLNRWQKPGDITTTQKFSFIEPTADAAYRNLEQSDSWFDNGSFLRLKNVSLSYELPATFTGKLRIEQARFYFQAQNLAVVSRYKGPDPETSTNVPLPRVLTLGLQVGL